MKRHLYNSLIAFFGGIYAYSGLYALLYLGILLGLRKGPFLMSLGGLTWILTNSFVEEGTKFLLIKRWEIGRFPYGVFLGLGWGLIETLYRSLNGLMIGETAVLLQVLTAGIISYSVKKNRSALGLLSTITIHTGYNWLVFYLLPGFMRF